MAEQIVTEVAGRASKFQMHSRESVHTSKSDSRFVEKALTNLAPLPKGRVALKSMAKWYLDENARMAKSQNGPPGAVDDRSLDRQGPVCGRPLPVHEGL